MRLPVLVFAALMLASCAPKAKRVEESDPAGSVMRQSAAAYCGAHDCSAYPAGFASFEFAGEWHYLPMLGWLENQGVPGTGTTMTIDTVDGNALSSETFKEARKIWAETPTVIPDARSLFFAPCCEAWENYFEAGPEEAVFAAQVRAYATPSDKPPAALSVREALAPDALPPEFRRIADRYDVYVASEAVDRISGRKFWSLRAQSKGPLFGEDPVFIECSGNLCQLQWTTYGNGYVVRFRVVNLIPGRCPEDCSRQEVVEHTFARIEAFLRDFELIWERSKARPPMPEQE